MSFRKSASAVSKNSLKWENNLTHFERSKIKRREIVNIDKNLNEMCRIPKQVVIIGRYNALATIERNKNMRCQIIAKELLDLWSKLNFPCILESSIKRKIEKLLDLYVKFLKRPNGNRTIVFGELFDVTNPEGIWLSMEDKKLYALQTSTKGDVGYTTAKETTIHPSKAVLFKKKDTTAMVTDRNVSDTTISSLEEDTELFESDDGIYEPIVKKVTCSTKAAVKIVQTSNVSTRNAAKICKELVKSGIDIPTPSQSGVYKASIKASERMEEKYMAKLKEEHWCLHFDGKKYGKKEVQVLVLTNELKEVRLAVMELHNGKSMTIFGGTS